MATEIIMPKVDMIMHDGTFVEWLKQEGDHVKKGEPLFVILTDKANIEIEAPANGILAGVRAQPDDVIPPTSSNRGSRCLPRLHRLHRLIRSALPLTLNQGLPKRQGLPAPRQAGRFQAMAE